MFKRLKTLRDECYICEEERDLEYGVRTETLKVRGKEDIEVDARVYYCRKGDHYFEKLEDEEEKFQIAFREYRKRRGLYQPEEIREIRNNYGLTQKEFARFLGWGEITVQRYETGAIQDDAHNGLIFLISMPFNFKKYFDKRRNVLPLRLVEKIERIIKRMEEKERQGVLWLADVDDTPKPKSWPRNVLSTFAYASGERQTSSLASIKSTYFSTEGDLPLAA